MPLPASWIQVPLVGDYTLLSGAEPAGRTVTFESAQPVVVDGVIVVPDRLTFTLDEEGRIPSGAALPSTTDPDVVPTGWAYLVTERFRGGRPPFHIFVPHDAVQIDLATVVPVVPPPELVSIQGPPGPPGVDGVDGSIAILNFHIDPEDGGLHLEAEVGTGTVPAFSIDADGNLGVTL